METLTTFYLLNRNAHLPVVTPNHQGGRLGGESYDAREVDGAAFIDEEVRSSDYRGYRLWNKHKNVRLEPLVTT